MAKLTIPDITVPVVDPKTGLANPDWYRALRALILKINAELP